MPKTKIEIVTIGRATLYRGDCLKLLPSLPKADVLVSDPPYGIGYVHSGGGQGRVTDGIGNVLSQKDIPSKVSPIIGDDKPFDPTPLSPKFRAACRRPADSAEPRMVANERSEQAPHARLHRIVSYKGIAASDVEA